MKYVYLVRAGKDNYKVGIAANVEKRMRGLQTSNANRIELVTAKKCDQAHIVERSIHGILREARQDGGTEWFKLDAETAIDIAILINDSVGISVSDVDELKAMLEEQTQKQKAIASKVEDLIEDINRQTQLRRAQLKAEANEGRVDIGELDAAERAALQRSKRAERDEARRLERQEDDERMYTTAVGLVGMMGKASTSMLQRRLLIGYGRAARMIERMEEEGVVGPADGIRPRQVLINPAVEAAMRILDESDDGNLPDGIASIIPQRV